MKNMKNRMQKLFLMAATACLISAGAVSHAAGTISGTIKWGGQKPELEKIVMVDKHRSYVGGEVFDLQVNRSDLSWFRWIFER